MPFESFHDTLSDRCRCREMTCGFICWSHSFAFAMAVLGVEEFMLFTTELFLLSATQRSAPPPNPPSENQNSSGQSASPEIAVARRQIAARSRAPPRSFLRCAALALRATSPSYSLQGSCPASPQG